MSRSRAWPLALFLLFFVCLQPVSAVTLSRGKCAGYVVGLLSLGFVGGVYFNAKSYQHWNPYLPGNVVIGANEIGIERFGEYAFVDQIYHLEKGAIVAPDKKILRGSEGTKEICGFRSHILRLDTEGWLTIGNPAQSSWVRIATPGPLEKVIAMETIIVALTKDGSLVQATFDLQNQVAFQGDGVLVGDKPVTFEPVKTRFTKFNKLGAETYREQQYPTTITAVNEEKNWIYVIHADGKTEELDLSEFKKR